jgi:hypothetical protein
VSPEVPPFKGLDLKPHTAFDLQGAYLKVGHALDTAEVLNGVHTRRTANDGYLMAARVRLAC